MQAALDSASLAAGRTWQVEKDLSLAEAQARSYYDASKPDGLVGHIITFSADPTNNSITMEASGAIATPFLSLARISSFELSAHAQSLLESDGNSEQSLEIGMMLDITGSMAGSKIQDLKNAAKDLIDIVVWEDQSRYSSRVALIPFADAVNLGSSALVTSVRGPLKSGSCSSSSSPCTGYTDERPNVSQWTRGTPAKWFYFRRPDGGTNTWHASSYCVTPRTGSASATDDAPNSDARKVGPSYGSSSASSCGYMVIDPYDLEVNSVQPLTNSKALLKRRIDKLVEGGSTAGQLGIAWTWYALSPSWARYWPSESAPTPYHTNKVQKIAVLMTDGEFNTGHCRGVVAQDSGAGSGGWTTKINCNSENGASDFQARTLCAAMKEAGIVVYTIGFKLDGNETALSTLRGCASDTTKFYDASSGAELRQAFRDIALQVVKLRLSQ